ncbi:Os04g0633700 [Oryza sativa Japonica Group]|uniref:Os04g0633700 protein n=1 Tax=Oryza sativa subsp. japonica TaxID=39947 RepID=A0A0P0WFD0_ORYSJ|nr:Os04g0633700 [Oryza sativa Japonica Group]
MAVPHGVGSTQSASKNRRFGGEGGGVRNLACSVSSRNRHRLHPRSGLPVLAGGRSLSRLAAPSSATSPPLRPRRRLAVADRLLGWAAPVPARWALTPRMG